MEHWKPYVAAVLAMLGLLFQGASKWGETQQRLAD